LHKGYDKMKNILEMQMNFMTNQNNLNGDGDRAKIWQERVLW